MFCEFFSLTIFFCIQEPVKKAVTAVKKPVLPAKLDSSSSDDSSSDEEVGSILTVILLMQVDFCFSEIYVLPEFLFYSRNPSRNQ